MRKAKHKIKGMEVLNEWGYRLGVVVESFGDYEATIKVDSDYNLHSSEFSKLKEDLGFDTLKIIIEV